MRTCITVVLIAAFVLTFGVSAFAAEKKEAAKPATAPVVPAIPKISTPPAMHPNFNVLFGTVTKINTSDPAKTVLEVNNDRDNKVHIIELTPATNLAKITDVTELKTGDTVRVMTRGVENKEVAINVVFGKIKNPPIPKPVTPPAAPAPAAKK